MSLLLVRRWFDRKNLPPDHVISRLPQSFQRRVAAQKDGTGGNTSGAVILGTKGVIFSPDDYGARYFMLPKEDFSDYQAASADVAAEFHFNGNGDQRQKWEFVSTIKGEYPGTMSNFGYAGRFDGNHS